MFGILDPMRWLALAAGIGLLVMSGLYGVQTVRLSSARATLATERAERAEDRAIAAETARKAEQRNAALTARHAAEEQDIIRVYTSELENKDADLRAATAVADGLRNDIEAFLAARDRPPGAATVATGDRRDSPAARLAQLFREADGFAGEVAGIADRRGVQVRALKRQIEIDRAACAVR